MPLAALKKKSAPSKPALKPKPMPRPPMLAAPARMQAKLEVGPASDRFEQEADRTAESVMRMPNPAIAIAPAPLQISRKCAVCEREEKDDKRLQKKSAGPAEASIGEAPASVHAALRSPGQPLDKASRAYFEPRFGQEFGDVRVHTGTVAAQSARDVSARAYTVGQNIVFAAGRLAPHQSDGRKLLAHELAHVVQQRRPEAAGAGQENCEQDAENAAHSIGGGITPVVRTGAVSGTVQRQPKGPAAQKKSRLVRVERYWRSTSARAFFADGSNEEVTFVDTSKLDGSSRPEGTFETVLNLTVDRSSTIRPHVDLASGTSGTNVKVVTRLSPADRISKLPTKVRAEVSEAFLGDTEHEASPEMMEFAADMGDHLKETSGTTKIEMEGRDPATVATMKTVDQWVSDQKRSLDKVGTMHRGKFAHLLNDIRQVGVTGPTKAEDLDAQDIELVLAGAAGGQSEFQTFDEFKRGMNFKLRTGRTSIPEENADNPDFYIRNEYRRAWKAEAAGLRKMSRIAAAAQAAPFIAIGASAVVGSGLALAEAGVAGLVARGVPYSLIGKWIGTSLVASSVVSHFGSARDEARAAGVDPNSARGLVSTASAAFLRGIGIGDVAENITDTSMQTGKSLNRSPLQRIVGAGGGFLNMLGLSDSFVPDAPGGLPAAGETSGAKAGIEDADTAGGAEPAAQPVAQSKGGQSAELNIPGPHPFFKKPAGNENVVGPPPEAQAAEVPLADTGTGGPTPGARVGGDATAQTGTGAGGAKMSGEGTKPDTVEQFEKRGGIVQKPKYGESGLKKPPKPPKPEITARPKERGFEEEREEKLGPAEDSPEVAANQNRRSPGGAKPPVRAEVGNFAHNSLPGYLERMRSDLAEAKTPQARAELEQQIAKLEAMTEWPSGLRPNKLSFEMSDGRQGIPDGIDVNAGKVYELKPDTESEWAKGGQYQADEYAKVLNEMHYGGRTDWVGEVIEYKAEEMTAQLRDWGVLPPEPALGT